MKLYEHFEWVRALEHMCQVTVLASTRAKMWIIRASNVKIGPGGILGEQVDCPKNVYCQSMYNGYGNFKICSIRIIYVAILCAQHPSGRLDGAIGVPLLTGIGPMSFQVLGF